MNAITKDDFPIKLIDFNDKTFQARLEIDDANVIRLADDIKQFGQRAPIGVQKKENDLYCIIYGFHRALAIKRLEKETIRAAIYEELSLEEAHHLNISDNTMHNDLTDLEKAYKVRYMKEQLNFSIEQLSDIFGVKKSAIYNYLKVMELDKWTKDALHRNKISLIHAVELSTRKELSERLQDLRFIRQHNWSVREYKNYKKERRFLTEIWLQIEPTVEKARSLLEYIQEIKETNICDAYEALHEYFDRYEAKKEDGRILYGQRAETKSPDYQTFENFFYHLPFLEIEHDYIVRYVEKKDHAVVSIAYVKEGQSKPDVDFDALIEKARQNKWTLEQLKEALLGELPEELPCVLVFYYHEPDKKWYVA